MDRITSWLDRPFQPRSNSAPTSTRLSPIARIYIGSVCAAGLFIVFQRPTLPVHDPLGLTAFLILGGLAQLMPIRFYKNASVSLAMVIALATILVFGPTYAVWVNLSSGLVHYLTQIRPKKRPLYRSAVTTSTLVVTAWVSGWVYSIAGGQIGPNSDYISSLFAVALAALTYYAINTILITAAMALEQRQSFWVLLRTNYQWLTLNVASLTPLAIGVALIYQRIGLVGLIVYLVPFIMAQYSFQLYARTMEDVHKTNEESKEANALVRKSNEELQAASQRIQRTNAALREANERLNVMYEISRSLVGSLHLDETLNRILAATQLIGFPVGFVAGPLSDSPPQILYQHAAGPAYAQWLLTQPDEPIQSAIRRIIVAVSREEWFLTGEPHVMHSMDRLLGSRDPKVPNLSQDTAPILTLIPLRVRAEPWGIVGVDSVIAPSPMEIKELLIFRSMAESALEMVLAHEQAEHDALMDTMTGLYNHRYFQEALQQELQAASQRNSILSLLMIDIDRFKELNDVHGHVVGDQVLEAVGRILHDNVRDNDIACRYGGDEFCILLPHTDRARGMEVASRIDRIVRAYPFRVRQESGSGDGESKILSLQVSIGVASFPEAAQTRAGLVEQADRACYRAKALGGGVVAAVGMGSAADNAHPSAHSIRLQLVK